jgi:hypothetical protein
MNVFTVQNIQMINILNEFRREIQSLTKNSSLTKGGAYQKCRKIAAAVMTRGMSVGIIMYFNLN